MYTKLLSVYLAKVFETKRTVILRILNLSRFKKVLDVASEVLISSEMTHGLLCLQKKCAA